MTLFSYIVARDYGFAPNPFNGICTLATCKGQIRDTAIVGDWIVGTGAIKRYNIPGRLIFAMRVTEKMTFNEYWNNPRFNLKKPRMNGSLKQAYGDNIYHTNPVSGDWIQENSHHSYANGLVNMHNLSRDTKFPVVLLSTHFFYFGEKYIDIPNPFRVLCVTTQGYKKNHDPQVVDSFLDWLHQTYSPGYKGNPLQFSSFERYNGL